MSILTDGLVLKVSDTGESDRVVTLLTADYGIVRAFANKAKKVNSKMITATQTLCYGQYSIYVGKNSNIIDDAVAKEVFFGLRSNMENLSLAQYFCSLAVEFIPEGEPAPDSLRVLLNSISFLESQRKSCPFLKAVTELKLLSLAGYAPDLNFCSVCGKNPEGNVVFNIEDGNFHCANCPGKGKVITAGVLAAMRRVVYSPVDRIYSFSLPESDEQLLSSVAEEFLLSQTHRTFKALEFYKTLCAN